MKERDDFPVIYTGKSSQEAPLRLGIAGCGRIVERGYLPALRGLAGVELAAVADPRPERTTGAIVGTGAAAFNSVERMIEASELDALVVATPARSHEEVATLAAAAGVRCLVEKPPAADLAGALGLAALDPAPAIGFNRRFLQGAALRPLVPAAGWLELELEIRFRQRSWEPLMGGDEALIDAGIHSIDLAAFLSASEPIAVRDAAVAAERASFELELGRGRARIRCATDRPYAERVEVRDRSGRPLAVSRTSRRRARLGRLRGGGDPLVRSLRLQLEEFATLVRGGEAGSLARAPEGATAMAVVEAARRSAELGGAEVTVAPLTAGPTAEGAA